MSLNGRILPATICLAVLMIVNPTMTQNSFLTWTFTNTTNNSLVEVHFAQHAFKEFYGDLCEESTRTSKLSLVSKNFLTFVGSFKNTSAPLLNVTKYFCSPDAKDAVITCIKVESKDSENCTTTLYCRYSVNMTLLGIECELPFVEIASSPGVNITATLQYDIVTVGPCAVGCSVDTHPSTLTTASSSSSSSSSSSLTSTSTTTPTSSSSGLTNERIIIIGLAIGLAILIVALIVLGVIVWRRRQKSSGQIMSNEVTERNLKSYANNENVNHGGGTASADIIHSYSTSKTSTSPETGTKDTKNQYETIDLDLNPEQGILTESSRESKNRSSIKSAESKKRALPSSYSEPETKYVTGPYSTVDLDAAVGQVTIASDQPENGNSPQLPEPRSQDIPSASENPYSEPETKNLTDPYTGINPISKSQKKKDTSDMLDMKEVGHDIPNPQDKVTDVDLDVKNDKSGNNISVSSPQDDLTIAGDENDASNLLPDEDSEHAYSKLHETQRHFQNPYNLLADSVLDTPTDSLESPNLHRNTETSPDAMYLPVSNDIVSDNIDQTIDDDDVSNEPSQSNSDRDQNDLKENPEVSMHDSDNEEIKYSSLDKNTANITSETGTKTAKENEYFQLESDAESSTDGEEGE